MSDGPTDYLFSDPNPVEATCIHIQGCACHLDHDAQIHDLLEEREELLTEIRRLQRGNHPAGRALRVADEAAWRDLQVALTERDAEHEGGGGA